MAQIPHIVALKLRGKNAPVFYTPHQTIDRVVCAMASAEYL